MIHPFKAITDLLDDDKIVDEISSFPEHVQCDMYRLMKDILKDDLYFVVTLEKYRRRPLRGILQ